MIATKGFCLQLGREDPAAPPRTPARPPKQATGAAEAPKTPVSQVNQPPRLDSQPPTAPYSGVAAGQLQRHEGGPDQGPAPKSRRPSPINPCCSILNGVGQRPEIHGAHPTGTRAARPSSNHRIHETSSASCAPNSRWICTIQEIDSAEVRTSRYGPASQRQGDQHRSSHCEARGLRAAQEGSLISLLMKSPAPRHAPRTGVAAGHGGLFALGGPPAAGFGCCWGAVLVKAEHLQGAKHDDLTVASPKTTRRCITTHSRRSLKTSTNQRQPYLAPAVDARWQRKTAPIGAGCIAEGQKLLVLTHCHIRALVLCFSLPICPVAIVVGGGPPAWWGVPAKSFFGHEFVWEKKKMLLALQRQPKSCTGQLRGAAGCGARGGTAVGAL
jgi:hypothetical protein